MKRVVLFGGSFDPVHIGHMMMALSALNLLKAERVIFIPSNHPTKNTQRLDGKLRKKMLDLAIKDYGLDEGKFIASSYEIKKETSYTIDTVLHFKEKYPKSKLYFLIGQDKIDSFPHWKEAEKISKLVQLIYVPRDKKEVDTSVVEKYHMESLPLMKMNIHSKDIRSGQHLYTSKSVIDFIADEQLYFCARLGQMMKKKRYRHSVSVAKTAYEIALRSKCGLDPMEGYQAGLFHDCGKNIPLEQQKALTDQNYPQYEPLPEFALHQFAGAVLARDEFGIDNEEILSAIAFHCTGKRDMSAMEKLIYAADKLEPTREFETKKGRLACYKNLDKGFIKMLKDQEKYFQIRNITYKEHFLSKEMYEQYLGE